VREGIIMSGNFMVPAMQHACDMCGAECTYNRLHCEECPDHDLCMRCSSARRGRCVEGHRFATHETSLYSLARQASLKMASAGIGWMLRAAMRRWPNRPCVGVKRSTSLADDGDNNDVVNGTHYRYMRYRELHERAMMMLRALDSQLKRSSEVRAKRLFPDDQDEQDSIAAFTQHHIEPTDREPMRVAIWLSNSLDWVVADVALALGGFASVPLDPNATPDAVQHILSLTNTRAIILDSARLNADPGAVASLARLTAEHVPDLLFAITVDDDAVPATCNGIPVHHLSVLADPFADRPVALTEDDDEDMDDSMLRPGRDRLAVFTLLFTSGSTGRPKGVIQTHGVWSYCSFEVMLMKTPLVGVIYRPLCYATDREALWRALANGGRVALFEPDRCGGIGGLFDELPHIGPQSFSAPPRVWTLLFEKFEAELKSELKAIPFDPDVSAYAVARASARKKLVQRYSRVVGARCSSVGTGGAKTRPEVLAFLEEVFNSPEAGAGFKTRFYESYGTTENGGITVNGAIPASVEVMLLDCPEMGFLTTDDPPRGEVCVITPDGTPGYWRDEQATNALIHVDENGRKWHRTGDIGEMRNGSNLTVIDRRSNLVKLSTSVFISPEHIESVLNNAPSVKEVFVYAESSWDFPLAVVTVSAEISDPASLTADAVRAEFRSVADSHNLPVNQLPKGIIISLEPFTVANKCLTISLKLARPGLRHKFQQALRELYAKLTHQSPAHSTVTNGSEGETKNGGMPPQDENADEEDGGMMGRQTSSIVFPSTAAEETTVDAVRAVASIYARVLGYPEPCDAAASAETLRAQSLELAMLNVRLRRATGVEVPMQTLWTATIREVAEVISVTCRAKDSIGTMTAEPAAVAAHGNIATQGDTSPRSAKNAPEKASVLAALEEQLIHDTTPPTEIVTLDHDDGDTNGSNVVFLTGATGFIGSFVLRSLLSPEEGSEQTTIRILCLVRAADAKSAFARLCEGAGADVDLIAAARASRRLDVVAQPQGDSVVPLLQAHPWATSVTDVLHCAAAVNHALPYSALAVSNVGLVRDLLVVFGRRPSLRRFVLVSTVSAVCLSVSSSESDETHPVERVPHVLLQQLQPSGYALTKWAAERLLCNCLASTDGGFFPRLSGCDVSILRCGMACWDSELGVGNAADWVTALFEACALLKSYPVRFRLPAPAPVPRRDLNLVPVDWVADAVAFWNNNNTSGVQSALPTERVPAVAHLINSRTVNVTPFLSLAAGSENTNSGGLEEGEWVRTLRNAAEGNNAPRQLQRAAWFFDAGVPGGDRGVSLRRTPALLPPRASISDGRLTELGDNENAARHFVTWIRQRVVN
jgi:long-subunit acyl-CoA synthetase (AMP-forming)/thioester reductase-like protein